MNVSAEITISGLVQGVGFRWYTQKRASELSLRGFVRNLEDGNVFVDVEGECEMIKVLVEKLHKGPTFSRVKEVTVVWKEYESRFRNFYVED